MGVNVWEKFLAKSDESKRDQEIPSWKAGMTVMFRPRPNPSPHWWTNEIARKAGALREIAGFTIDPYMQFRKFFFTDGDWPTYVPQPCLQLADPSIVWPPEPRTILQVACGDQFCRMCEKREILNPNYLEVTSAPNQ